MSAPPTNVLIVEDDEEDYLIAQRLLSHVDSSKLVMDRAEDLDSALHRLSENGTDIVLLDLSLPDSQGLETYRKVRAHAPAVPVVLLTGLSDEDLGARAVQEGAQDYLVKGQVDGRLLARTICYAIERKRTEEQLERYAAQLRAKNTQMASDLAMAKEIQRAFLPTRAVSFPPDAPAGRGELRFSHVYLPSETVGGDFFDVFAVSDHAAGVFVCDVMGHGMRAALITAIVRGLLEELKPVAAAPDRFLAEVNRGFAAILRRPEELIFATAAYVVVDAACGELRYACAGHPMPLHVSRQNGTVKPVSAPCGPGGPALGIEEDCEFALGRLSLAAGDLLVLFTDGLTEAENSAGEPYGEERLAGVLLAGIHLPTPSLFEQLISDVETFHGGKDFEDDVCVVGIDCASISAAPAKEGS